jgi:glycosyltransferase involved in cell wall biosynthesis
VRLVIATDAWHPQINGVVRSIERMVQAAPAHGAAVRVLGPDAFRSLPLPGYPEIRLALARPRAVAADLAWASHVHVATEGPVGLAVRAACRRAGRAFTTSYHTRFPEYLAARLPVPERLSYAWLRRFHAAAAGTMVSTASLERELAARGFANLMRWGRGADAALFRPEAGHEGADPFAGLPRPIFLNVGRVAVEKNLEAFLALDLPGSKVLVGDGPARARLAAAYPEARFLGALTGPALAAAYARADVFVFPSLTDTFGIVLLEALACGLPVAAFPVAGPRDVVAGTGAGVLDADLRAAALAALAVPRAQCRAVARDHTWEASARQFFTNVAAAAAGARATATPAALEGLAA